MDSPAAPDHLLTGFADPPASWRPMPFLVVNGELTEARLTAMLEQMAERGCGGVFLHPRPGLRTEYLSRRWFELWEHALGESERLGLECHIYDENSYPSGFGGGHTVALDPRAAACHLHLARLDRPVAPVSPNLLAAGLLHPATGQALEGEADPRQASREHPVAAVYVRPAEPEAWTAGFPYVDLSLPETTRAYLRSSYEPYARRFRRSFGRSIRYVFADEPTLGHGGGLPYSATLARSFAREHGYALAPHLLSLFLDRPGAEAVRHDYFRTLHRLWAQNYLRPVAHWCARRGLAFTGHFNEHTWPSPYSVPDAMAALRWMQAPGVDLLAFQFRPDDPARGVLYQLTLWEVASVARQFGRERVLCECYGGGGYDYGVRQFKPLSDWLLAHGVNLLNPHLSAETLSGSRRYDWPQTLSDHSPWWDAYRVQADHDGRVNWALGQGRERPREILVLQPTTTGWVRFRGEGEGTASGRRLQPELQRLRERHGAFLQTLGDDQLDFDLGSEYLLGEEGGVAGGHLTLGQARYTVVVVPPDAENLMRSTVRLLERFLRAGGTVWSLPSLPTLVEGRPAEEVRNLAESHPERWRVFPDLPALRAAWRSAYPPPLTARDGSALPAGLAARTVTLPDGRRLHFLCNPWNHPWQAEVRLAGRSLTELDTRRGRSVPRPAEPDSQGGVVISLTLGPGEHALWLAGDEPPPVPMVAGETGMPAAATVATVRAVGVRRESPNLVALDYCRLAAGDRPRDWMPVYRADGENWRAQGFAGNLWHRAIQFRRNFLEAPVAPDSGFAVEYAFHLDPAAAAEVGPGLALAVERPALYRIHLNEQPLDPASGRPFWDEDLRLLPIGPAVVPGPNLLRLEARPFHVLCELAPVWVVGDFALRRADPGFQLTRPSAPEGLDWRADGMPFYPWGVAYEYEVEIAAAGSGLTVELGEWHGSAVQVQWDGEAPAWLAHPPHRWHRDGPVTAGTHRLTLRLRGNLKNLLGPHFCDGLPGLWSWTDCPGSPPPGERYRFYRTGLAQPPQVFVS